MIMSEIVEVLFKGEVRELFVNPGPVILRPGHYVVVQAEKGEDMGVVILKGEWVSKKAGKPPLRQVIRKATPEDLERREANEEKEADAFKVCRERIEERELKMKLVDVECRFDGNRITFYFTAEKRVDFRELVKDLASVYRTRIELRQIGVRDEAKRIGGFGSCGRKFCCTTFLREFEPVTLKMAKEQHLSLSPSKISGACGRLMCCLMYEVDAYRKALHSYPKVGSKLKLGDREVQVNRVDIFREGVFVTDPEAGEEFIPLDRIPSWKSRARDAGNGDGDGRAKKRKGEKKVAGAEAKRPYGEEEPLKADGKDDLPAEVKEMEESPGPAEAEQGGPGRQEKNEGRQKERNKAQEKPRGGRERGGRFGRRRGQGRRGRKGGQGKGGNQSGGGRGNNRGGKGQ
jgi:cell fate regulator YaaT (PSP1 superfamily)